LTTPENARPIYVADPKSEVPPKAELRAAMPKVLLRWFTAHIDDPATRFRERTVRALSLIMFVFSALLLVPAELFEGNAFRPIVILSLLGMGASLFAIHRRQLSVASWLFALTLLLDAFAMFWLAGYYSRIALPLLMIVFLFSTLVLPRNYLWALLVVAGIVLGIVVPIQAEKTGDPAVAVIIDALLSLTVLTIGLYIFRLEFDSRLESTEKARIRAENADRLKLQFLSNVSHELRTPLNAIIGYTELMLSGLFEGEEAEQKQAEFNPKILRNAQNLRIMVDDLLDLAKIESGAARLEPTPCSPRQEIEHVVDMQQGLVGNKPVKLLALFATDTPESAYWDVFKVQQVLTNLIGNAIKFTDQGKVEIVVSPLHTAQGETMIRIAVNDTGVGMPPGAEKYIFEKFRQVDGTGQRKHGGTGLGLSITKGLIDVMKGTVTVTSEQGKGSSFVVDLPRWMGTPESALSIKPQADMETTGSRG
jgi:signal transduction histidine kinase